MFSQKPSRSSSIVISLSALIGLNSFAIAAIAADTTANVAPQAADQSAIGTNASASTTSTATARATTSSTATPATTPDANAKAATSSDAKPVAKTKWKPGEELTITTNAEDLVPTDDADMAKKQVDAYPDSPEAAFIYAVALTRTSKVEDALKEVRRARKLAEQKGGNAYFDKMITTYEDMLKTYPNENRVRYGLAWAYYMKAYLVANYSRKVAAWKAVNGDPAEALKKQQAAAAAGTPATSATATAAAGTTAGAGNTNAQIAAATGASPADVAKAQAALKTAVQPGKGLDLNAVMGAVGSLATGNTANLPKIPSVMDKVDPADIPQIKSYYEKALGKLDELIAQKPDDVWALVYRAHLKAEYNGNLDEAMTTWASCREKFPNNPAAYFFLGEGYLKQGNLKESLNNVSKAVALRSMGF